MEAHGAVDLTDLAPLAALGDPVRRRLYEQVAGAGRTVGRDEAAEAAGVSRSLAAYHLDKLVEHGLLEAGFGRPSGRTGPGAGRPAKLYRRARRAFTVGVPPSNYRVLGELLARAAADDGVLEALARVARELGWELGERAKARSGGRKRLAGALQRSGYEPFVTDDGTLRLRNCPFEELAADYPESVCGLNLSLLEGLLEGLSLSDTRAVLAPAEGHCCVALAPEGL